METFNLEKTLEQARERNAIFYRNQEKLKQRKTPPQRPTYAQCFVLLTLRHCWRQTHLETGETRLVTGYIVSLRIKANKGYSADPQLDRESYIANKPIGSVIIAGKYSFKRLADNYVSITENTPGCVDIVRTPTVTA